MRENLAYAYALDGRWRDARMMAATDTPAYKLDARLSQWAETAQPDFARWRVANLIGVPLRVDTGAPVSLALASAGATGGAPVAAPAVAAASPAQPASGSAPAVASSAAPVAPMRTAEAKTNAAAPASEVAVKTDANGELPALDHSPAAVAPITPATSPKPASPAALASSAAPVTVVASAVPASSAAPDAVALHRADTTHLVGAAVAHADVVAARHARVQSRHHAAEHLALARQGATAPSTASDVPASTLTATQPSAPAVVPMVASAETHAQPTGTAASAHPRKAPAHHDAALAEASRGAPTVSSGPSTGPLAGTATHLVQLGSFSSQQNAEHARQTFLARDPGLGHRQFVITQALVNGRNFWRVAVMGFNAASAGQTCSAIRHHGGACFAYAAGHLPGGQTLAMNTPGVTPGATPGRDQPARR